MTWSQMTQLTLGFGHDTDSGHTIVFHHEDRDPMGDTIISSGLKMAVVK